MKVGVIVCSYTNNTLCIAKELRSGLIQKGYDVEIDSIKANNDNPNNRDVELAYKPKVDTFDALIFASCVRGFDCAPVFKEYINSLDSLSDKRVAGFVSQYFPLDILGGNQALKSMKDLVEKKKGVFTPLNSIHVKSKNKEKMITSLVEKSLVWLEL